MKTVQFTNEKGNARPAVRAQIKEQAENYLINATDRLVKGPNGLFMEVATDEATGKTIYVTIALTVTTNDPAVEKEKKAKASKKAVEPEVVVDLFDAVNEAA